MKCNAFQMITRDSFTRVMYCFIHYDKGINLLNGENIPHEDSEIDLKRINTARICICTEL